MQNPAVISVAFSGISPRHVFGLAEGFLPLSGAYQLILTLVLIAIEDPQRSSQRSDFIYCLYCHFAHAISPSWVKQVSGDEVKKSFHRDPNTFWEGS